MYTVDDGMVTLEVQGEYIAAVRWFRNEDARIVEVVSPTVPHPNYAGAVCFLRAAAALLDGSASGQIIQAAITRCVAEDKARLKRLNGASTDQADAPF